MQKVCIVYKVFNCLIQVALSWNIEFKISAKFFCHWNVSIEAATWRSALLLCGFHGNQQCLQAREILTLPLEVEYNLGLWTAVLPSSSIHWTRSNFWKEGRKKKQSLPSNVNDNFTHLKEKGRFYCKSRERWSV